MKKYFVILIIILIDIFLYINKTKSSTFEFVDINLDKNEIGLTLLSLDNSKSILINKSSLLILEYIDSLDLEKKLNLYGIDVLENVILNGNYTPDIKSYNKHTLNNKVKLNNLTINKKDNIEIINYYDYSFCIYKTGKNKDLSNCDFIYFLNIDDVDFTDEVLVAFFDSDIDKDDIEKYYDKWVDSYILNNKNTYTLKLLPNDYNVVEVPIN